MTDPDQIPHQQRHRRPPPPPRRLLPRTLRPPPSLLHNLLREHHDLPVQQQKTRQPVPPDQTELLLQPRRDLLRHPAVAPRRRLITQLSQIPFRRIPLRQRRLRQRIPQIRSQVESAPLRYPRRVRHRLRKLRKKSRHLLPRPQIELIVGLQMRQRLVDRRVQPDRHQRILQPVSLRRVVMHVVAHHQPDARLLRESRQLAVPHRVPLQKILLQRRIDRIPAIPLRIRPQQPRRLLPPPRQRQPRHTTVPPPRQQYHPLRMARQMLRIQPRLPAIHPVRKRKQT